MPLLLVKMSVDILRRVVHYLDAPAAIRLGETCRQMHNFLTKEESLWASLSLPWAQNAIYHLNRAPSSKSNAFRCRRNVEVELIDYIIDISKNVVDPQELFSVLSRPGYFQLYCRDLLTHLAIYLQVPLPPADTTEIGHLERPIPSVRTLRLLRHIYEADTSIDNFLTACFNSVLIRRVIHRAHLCVRNNLQSRLWRLLLQADYIGPDDDDSSISATEGGDTQEIIDEITRSASLPSATTRSGSRDDDNTGPAGLSTTGTGGTTLSTCMPLEEGFMIVAEIQSEGCDRELIRACIAAKARRVWKALEPFLLPIANHMLISCGGGSRVRSSSCGLGVVVKSIDNVTDELLRRACRYLDRTKVLEEVLTVIRTDPQPQEADAKDRQEGRNGGSSAIDHPNAAAEGDNTIEEERHMNITEDSGDDGNTLINEGYHTAASVDRGLEGDNFDYYNYKNSFIDSVVRRGKGIPISLSALAAYLCREVGLEGVSVSGLPGHVLLSLTLRYRSDKPYGVPFTPSGSSPGRTSSRADRNQSTGDDSQGGLSDNYCVGVSGGMVEVYDMWPFRAEHPHPLTLIQSRDRRLRNSAGDQVIVPQAEETAYIVFGDFFTGKLMSPNEAFSTMIRGVLNSSTPIERDMVHTSPLDIWKRSLNNLLVQANSSNESNRTPLLFLLTSQLCEIYEYELLHDIDEVNAFLQYSQFALQHMLAASELGLSAVVSQYAQKLELRVGILNDCASQQLSALVQRFAAHTDEVMKRCRSSAEAIINESRRSLLLDFTLYPLHHS